jgi:hypothetical protein
LRSTLSTSASVSTGDAAAFSVVLVTLTGAASTALGGGSSLTLLSSARLITPLPTRSTLTALRAATTGSDGAGVEVVGLLAGATARWIGALCGAALS